MNLDREIDGKRATARGLRERLELDVLIREHNARLRAREAEPLRNLVYIIAVFISLAVCLVLVGRQPGTRVVGDLRTSSFAVSTASSGTFPPWYGRMIRANGRMTVSFDAHPQLILDGLEVSASEDGPANCQQLIVVITFPEVVGHQTIAFRSVAGFAEITIPPGTTVETLVPEDCVATIDAAGAPHEAPSAYFEALDPVVLLIALTAPGCGCGGSPGEVMLLSDALIVTQFANVEASGADHRGTWRECEIGGGTFAFPEISADTVDVPADDCVAAVPDGPNLRIQRLAWTGSSYAVRFDGRFNSVTIGGRDRGGREVLPSRLDAILANYDMSSLEAVFVGGVTAFVSGASWLLARRRT